MMPSLKASYKAGERETQETLDLLTIGEKESDGVHPKNRNDWKACLIVPSKSHAALKKFD